MAYLNLSAFEDKSQEYQTKIFDLFIQYMPIWLNDLQIHFDNKDWKQLANTAHTIKPNILLFGIEALRGDIVDIETIARERTNLDNLDALIKKTIDIGLLAVEELKSIMK